MAPRGLGVLQNRKNFLLDRQFVRIGQLESIAGENFDSVISPRIVRCGDDYSGIEFLRARQVGNSGRGDHAGAADFNLARRQAKGNPVCNPTAGFARVLADDDRGSCPTFQIMAEGASDQKVLSA